MKKNKFYIIASVLALLIAISGCGQKKPELNVYNWGDYIDESILQSFEEKYNIKVNYDTYTTNEDMYVKVNSEGTHYDLVVPSSYMIKRMIEQDMLEKLDFTNIPNYQYIGEPYKNLDHDPNNEYSVPYVWGTVGILYNKTMVATAPTSWKVLWDKQYAKQILMIDSQRDSIGIALKLLGYSLNTDNLAELEAAKNALIEQKPLVLAYVVDEVKDKMIAEEAAIAVVWSGDAVYCSKQNPDLEYVIPSEGTNIWFDSFVIPKGAANKEAAELFINYLCDTEVAFKNVSYTGFATPHTEVFKLLPKELTGNPSAYPTAAELHNSEVFADLGNRIKDFDRIWTEIKSY